ncbi:MAG: lytic transglycosylase, partial [Acetobacteraceae bacterium]
MRGFLFAILMLAGVAPRCWADVLGPFGADPGAQCRQAIAAAEQAQAIPARLLASIGVVESGRRDPTSGVVTPWPWTVDADGAGYFYPTKQAAIEAVRAFQANGTHSIDVGCMQVSLLHHPDAFADLQQAFDPGTNARWAAGFLRRLYL